MSDRAHQTIEAVKAAPPVAVGGLTLLGVQLSDLVLLVTLAYTLMQCYVLWRDKFGGAKYIKTAKGWFSRGRS